MTLHDVVHRIGSGLSEQHQAATVSSGRPNYTASVWWTEMADGDTDASAIDKAITQLGHMVRDSRLSRFCVLPYPGGVDEFSVYTDEHVSVRGTQKFDSIRLRHMFRVDIAGWSA